MGGAFDGIEHVFDSLPESQSAQSCLRTMAPIPDGAIVWVKDPQKDSTAAFVKATVAKFTEGRGYAVTMPDGSEKNVRAVDCAQANPEGMSAPDNCYLIHISESTIIAGFVTGGETVTTMGRAHRGEGQAPRRRIDSRC